MLSDSTAPKVDACGAPDVNNSLGMGGCCCSCCEQVGRGIEVRRIPDCDPPQQSGDRSRVAAVAVIPVQ